MMKFLLDTHALIWSLYDLKKIPDSLKKQLEDPMHEVYFSSISCLEISLKISLGKLKLDMAELLKEASDIGFQEFPFRGKHAEHMLSLPAIHSDPFDRALIAQAIVENLVIASRDDTIKKYPVTQRW